MFLLPPAACRPVDPDALLGSTAGEAHADTGVAALAVSFLARGILLGGEQDVALGIQQNVGAYRQVRAGHDDVG